MELSRDLGKVPLSPQLFKGQVVEKKGDLLIIFIKNTF